MVDNYQELLGGIIATIRAADDESLHDLINVVRSGADLQQLAVHVRNTLRMSPPIRDAFSQINFGSSDHTNLQTSASLQRIPTGSLSGTSRSSSTRTIHEHEPEFASLLRKRRQRTGRIDDVVNPPISVSAKPWTSVTDDDEFVSHLFSLWFTWAHPWWHWVDEHLFLSSMRKGDLNNPNCSPFLVNMILADSCVSL